MKNNLIDYAPLGKLFVLTAEHGWELVIVYLIYKAFTSMDVITIVI